MSVANDVLKWAKKNTTHSGSGNEIFVPDASKYPHMHITNTYVGYSTDSKHRRPIVEGDLIKAGALADVLNEATGEALAVAQHIQATW